MYFSQCESLRRPSAYRAGAHQGPPGELNRTAIAIYLQSATSWAIYSEPTRARRIIVFISKIQLVGQKNIEAKHLFASYSLVVAQPIRTQH